MEYTDWMHASNQKIQNMSVEDTMEIVQHQIDLGYSKGRDFKPRPHMTKALEIVMELVKKNM